LFEPAIAERLPYRAAKSLQIHEIRCTEFILCLTNFMPKPQVALRTALVTAMAFPHH